MGEAWHGFGIEHVLARSMRDSAAMLDATAGADVGAPYAAPHQAGPFLREVTRNPGRLRIAFTSHLPIGMHFVGRVGDEAMLFRLAGQLERAQPWADRLPVVVATD